MVRLVCFSRNVRSGWSGKTPPILSNCQTAFHAETGNRRRPATPFSGGANRYGIRRPCDTLFSRCKPLWNSTSVRRLFLALKTVTRRKKTGASLTVARDASENALPNFFRVNVHSLSPKGNHGSRLFAVRLLAVRLYRGPRKESKFNDGRQSQERWDRIASFATLDTRNFTTTFAGISMEVLLRGLIPLRCLW